MANTTNFGWETPDDTDLVKDGAAAMRTLGNAIDASLVDLKGGTTGQVLSKNTNTDMDFTWVTTDDANAIQNAIVDAKGDLIAASAADTPARLAVGANGETLVADSSTTTGLRWQETYAAGKNKIINGAMLTDQRNSGAAVTVNSPTLIYTLDRWSGGGQTSDGVFTIQQDSTAPAGFNNSLKVTVTTADASIGSTQFYQVNQQIEGTNCFDLSWGTSGAKTISLSFWVRSSVTGTFTVSVRNSVPDRSYVATYTINSADTWEKKTITIPGDTSGTWLRNTGIGIRLTFSLGDGASRQTTAGAWTAGSFTGATGMTQLISTLNATWYVTGVQLEIGSVATAFTLAGGDIAGELAACQRYYYLHSTGANKTIALGAAFTSGEVDAYVPFKVSMRTAPTLVASSGTNYYNFNRNSATDSFNSWIIYNAHETGCQIYNNTEIASTAGQAGIVENANASASVAFSAEL